MKRVIILVALILALLPIALHGYGPTAMSATSVSDSLAAIRAKMKLIEVGGADTAGAPYHIRIITPIKSTEIGDTLDWELDSTVTYVFGAGFLKTSAEADSALLSKLTILGFSGDTANAIRSKQRDTIVAVMQVMFADSFYAWSPSGAVCIWTGGAGAIPTGWQLADGTNGTINLVDNFIVGSGNTYAENATGGATSHTHTVDGHTHTISASGTHTHGITWGAGNDISAAPGIAAPATTDADGDHNHGGATGSATPGTDSQSNLPPYYAVVWIQKL